MSLYEKYRPKRFEDVLGQDKAVKMIQRATSIKTGGNAFWLSGASGTGKTTLARIIADKVADSFFVTEYDSGNNVSQADIKYIDRTMQLYGGGRPCCRAVVINEAHGLTSGVVRTLLGILERIPPHVVFIFTTTKEGQEKLFDDEIDACPQSKRR